MTLLADKLVPPYYAAIIENKPHASSDEPVSIADHMVSTALRRPGFLGLETGRSGDGRPVTVAYWRDLADVEGWQSESGTVGDKSYPLEVCRVGSSNDNAVRSFLHDGKDAAAAHGHI
ncbi:MAG: antibiotic biosynthesis monooxygenase family protein [Rhodospirillales bacterium]